MANPNWVKGVSGNPSGRQKVDGHVKALARQYTEEALLALVDEMQNGSGPARVTAANSILDRAWGKPHQEIEHTGDGGPIIVMWAGEEELARRRSELQAQGAIPRLPSPN